MEKLASAMKNTSVEFPGVRYTIIQEAKALSDIKKQKNEWANSDYKHAFWDDICTYTDTLVDAMPCEEDPPRAIGVVFRNYEELVYVQFLIQCLMRIIKEIGIKQPDSAYLNSPLWADVVEAAKHAYEVLMKDEDLDALLEAERNRVVE
jgi:hypothetical protein